MRTHVVLSILFATAIAAACGGEAQPAKSPDDSPTTEVDGGEEITMANPDGAAPPDPETAPPALQVPFVLPKEAVKIALKGKRKANLELQPDGTFTNGSKTAASLASNGAIHDAKGQLVLTLKGDALTTPSGATLATFTGESELTTSTRDKLVLDDAGALSLNEKEIGRVEAVSNSKRAALVGVWIVLFAPADKLQEPRPKPGKPTPKGRSKKR